MPQLTIQQSFALAAEHHRAGRLQEAEQLYRQIIAINPNSSEAHYDLGIALRDMGRLEEAINAYRQAIALKPDDAQAHGNLGVALKGIGRLDEAIAAYGQAIALRPRYAEAHYNLGIALHDKGELDQSIAAFRHAVLLNPNFPQAQNNLGSALKDTGQLDEAIAAHRVAIAIKADYPTAHSNLVATLYYHPGFDERSIGSELRRWNRQHAEPLSPFIRPHSNDRDPDRPLRIGFVSPDFRRHPVGFAIGPLLRNHDRRQFEVFCFSNSTAEDAVTETIRASADHWHSIAKMPDDQAAELIRQNRIDILIDLAVHTTGNRLLVFARKPAPVQATYLGYCGSTGLDAIDYRISDPFIDPPGEDESCYSEKTIRLPRTFLCWEWRGGDVPIGELPTDRRREITFGSLNNFCKVTPAVLRCWGDLLTQMPHSRLILRTPPGETAQRARKTLLDCGVAENRIALVGWLPGEDYLRLCRQVDIGLDPFPYPGFTTTLDLLWMGVPVVTLSGPTAVSRGGRSILSNLGLPELVASTPQEYVRIALGLAGDWNRLDTLRRSMRARMLASPQMDAAGFARDMEAAYRQMWRNWCEKPSGH